MTTKQIKKLSDIAIQAELKLAMEELECRMAHGIQEFGELGNLIGMLTQEKVEREL